MTRKGLMNWMVVAAVGIGMCLAGAGCGPKEAAAPSDPGTPAVKDEGSAPAETPVAPKDVGGSGTIETIGEGADTITLVRVEGTRYEMGYWHGKLLADQIAETWKLANGMVQKMADEVGLPIAMFDDLAGTLWNEKYFDTKAWGEEYQGVADGCAAAGHPEITFEVMKKLAAIPDISEYNCSLFVAWGNATAGEDDMFQMRNLDWSMDTGLQQYPVVVIYSPVDGLKHAMVGFAGMSGGAVGGMNEKGLAISEIMGHFGDDETLEGMPFPVLLRDLLYYDTTLDGALTRMRDATRTNQYHYALGDPNAPDPKGRLLFTSNTRFDEFPDNTSVTDHPCVNPAPYHASLDDAVYWKNHNGRDNDVLFNAINERYGQIDAEKAIEIAQIACVDGTLVSIIYHNNANEMYVAFAEGTTPGPRQQFVRISLD